MRGVKLKQPKGIARELNGQILARHFTYSQLTGSVCFYLISSVPVSGEPCFALFLSEIIFPLRSKGPMSVILPIECFFDNHILMNIER